MNKHWYRMCVGILVISVCVCIVMTIISLIGLFCWYPCLLVLGTIFLSSYGLGYLLG